DSDTDGKVSAEEFLSRVSSRADTLFERRDRNLDGVLTQDEQQSRRRAEAPDRKRPRDQARRERGRDALTACIQQSIPDYTAPARPGRDGGVPAFDTMDADQNGSLTLAEVTTALENRALARFNELDTNSDGFI